MKATEFNSLRSNEELNEIIGQRFNKATQNFKDNPKRKHYVHINGENSIYVEGEVAFPLESFRGYYIGSTGRSRALVKLDALLILQCRKGLFVDRSGDAAYCWGFKTHNSPKFSLLLWFKTYHEEKIIWITSDGFLHVLSDILCDEGGSRVFDFFEPICNQYFRMIESTAAKLANEEVIGNTYKMLEELQSSSEEGWDEFNDYSL